MKRSHASDEQNCVQAFIINSIQSGERESEYLF